MIPPDSRLRKGASGAWKDGGFTCGENGGLVVEGYQKGSIAGCRIALCCLASREDGPDWAAYLSTL